MTDAEQCLICLEKFTEDEAYIPELDCECAIFVHWSCWEPWTGGCLYCREISLEEYDELIIPEPRYAIREFIIHNNQMNILFNLSLCFFSLYFFIILHHQIE